mgnify:CR=1 FL=1|tara:strand:- start:770 stop:1000 length:231 start_codon:yes stop_codon:yes gene_type:complete
MAKLKEEELTRVRELLNEFNGLKIQLGDAYISQQMIMKQIDDIKGVYAQVESELSLKYGEDATINIETGEVIIPEK